MDDEEEGSPFPPLSSPPFSLHLASFSRLSFPFSLSQQEAAGKEEMFYNASPLPSLSSSSFLLLSPRFFLPLRWLLTEKVKELRKIMMIFLPPFPPPFFSSPYRSFLFFSGFFFFPFLFLPGEDCL